MLRTFPMILIAVAAYNLLVFGGGAAGHDAAALLAHSITVPMSSGDAWKISAGDALVTLTLALLFIEVVKATRASQREIINHALSLLTFIAAVVEFLVLKGFATSTFFLITAMCLFDVVAGYSLSIITAKRDVTIAPHAEH